MRKVFFLIAICLMYSIQGISQRVSAYRGEKDKIHNLIHTKLKVDFNFEQKTMNGEAWITAKPHFYATNTLTLDAKAMLIHEVSMDNQKLPYNYDNFQLIIDLPKRYTRDQEFTV